MVMKKLQSLQQWNSSLCLFWQAEHTYLVRTVFVYIVLICFYLNLLNFEFPRHFISVEI